CRISAAFQPGWTTNVRAARAETREYVPSLRVAAGDEIMAFHLGSTVVALFERGARIREELVPGTEIRLGQPIANA
ncbi:MAG: phosphatidylserine decarboxylase, partial [Gemmatimonadota bacterium]